MPLALLAALTGYLTHGQVTELRHTEREIRGLATLHHLFHLTTAVQEARGLIHMADYGNPELTEAISDAERHVDQALAKAVHDPGAREIGLSSELENLLEPVHRLLQQAPDGQRDPAAARERFDAFSRIITQLLVTMGVTANRSGLLEGPELDGHYLMDLAINRLGPFSETLGRARGITAALMLKDALSAADHRELHQSAQSLSLGMEGVIYTMAVLARVAPHLEAGFDPFRKQLSRRISLFSEQIGRVDAGNPTVHAEQLFSDATRIISIVELLHDQAIIQMDLLLAERQARLRDTLFTSLMGTAVTAAVILLLVTFYYRGNRRSAAERDATIRTLDIIGAAQTDFIADATPRQAFDRLLSGLLELTGSEGGFIAEVLHADGGAPYLKLHALANVDWNQETRRLHDEHAADGMELHNLDTLFGAALTSGEPVIANDPAGDPRRGGLPAGHPPLDAFLGVPIHKGRELIGMAGLANRPGGYSAEVVDTLRPYLATVANLISAHRAERATADSEERHRAVISTMVDAVVVINDNGIIERFNPAAERMFGHRVDEVIGRNVNILMPEPYRSEHDAYISRYKETGEAHILGVGREVEGARKDGSVFPLDLSVSQMQVGGKCMYVGILRDITERKRMERIKGEFISTVSHELRTPLTSVRGALGLLSGGAAGALPDKAAELLTIAHNNTERLLLLINDILDIDKIESGNMPFRFAPTEVAAFIDEAVKSHQGYAEQHGARIEVSGVEEGLTVNADPDRMMQVMANLLSNAAKFSPANGVVEVGAALRGNRVRIRVTDHGPGIPEAFQARVFDKFTQSDTTDTRQAGGTGLGLSIARAIVEKHGGEIDFTTRAGEGTTFFVDLPAVGAHARKERETVSDDKAQVLVVEDDTDIARIITGILANGGIRCDVAANGEDGLKMLAEKRYRVITLDLSLPGMSGVDFLHTVRRRPETRRIPVVVVSATSRDSDEEFSGGALEVFDWLGKPIDEQRLLVAVREATRSGEVPRILHVEDESDVRRVVAMLLEGKADITEAPSLNDARTALAGNRFDLVLLDQGLPDGSGVDLLDDLRQLPQPPRVVIFSALDVTRETEKRVDIVLRKATTSNARLFDTIKRYL